MGASLRRKKKKEVREVLDLWYKDQQDKEEDAKR